MNLPLSTSSWKYQPDSKNHIHIAERDYIKTLIFNSFNSVNSFNLSNNCHKELHLRWWSGSWISPWLQWYFASQFSFGKNLIQFDSHLCGKQPSKEIGKSYFNTVGSSFHSSFCNRSSLFSAANYCHKELHLKCCRHPGSVFDDNICQKVIFIRSK